MKEKIDKIENFGLKNLSGILITVGIIILGLFLWQQIFCVINNFWNTGYSPKTITLEYTITSLGAIFAFWYGLKKYERDKEMKLLEKYKDLQDIDFNEVLKKYNEIYFLYYNNNISENLFNELTLILDLKLSSLIKNFEVENKGKTLSENIFINIISYGNNNFRSELTDFLINKFRHWLNADSGFNEYSDKFNQLQKNNNASDHNQQFLQVIINALEASKN